MKGFAYFVGRPDNREAWLQGLHPKQLEFVRDPSKRKCALAGRRGGKSEGLTYWFADGWEGQPGETSLFLARTAGHAYSIIWPTFMRVNSRHNLNLRFREDRMLVIFPNGHKVKVGGADTLRDIEKYRGPRYWKVGIDEAGSWPTSLLEYAVNDIFDPALMDLDGHMALTGSPGLVPRGFFYDKTRSDGTEGETPRWPTHTFTCVDNPYVNGAEYIEKKKTENRWDEDNPTLIREYYGRWVLDESATIYPYLADRNRCRELPTGYTFKVLSIDLGYKDDTTWTVSVSKRGYRNIWYLRSFGRTRQTPSQVAAEIMRLQHEFGGFHRIVMDAADLQLVEGFRQDYGLPIQAAEKKNKSANIRFMQDAIRAGFVQVYDPPVVTDYERSCRQLLAEWETLPWNEERTDHHPQYADHCSDGALYGFRAHPIHSTWEIEPPEPGSPEAIDAEAERKIEELSERIRITNSGMSPSRKRAALRRLGR